MENKKVKIVYNDGSKSIGVSGKILSEDEFFINLLAVSGDKFRIGKKTIISIKDLRS